MPGSSAHAWAFALVYLLVAVLSLAVGSAAWRRREAAATGRYLALAMAGCTAWSLADTVTMLAVLGVLPPVAARVGILAVLPAASIVMIGFWTVCRTVADPDWHARRLVAALLAVEPSVVIVASISDPWTHAVMASGGSALGSGHWFAWQPGWVFWAHIGYSYLLLASGLVGVLRTLTHGGALQRRQAGALLLSGLIPLPANVVSIMAIGHMLPEVTGVSFAITGAIDAYALLRYGLGKIVPVARGLVFERLHDAVLVIDRNGRLLDVNAAGERLIRSVAPHVPEQLAGLPLRQFRQLGQLGHGGIEAAGDGHPPEELWANGEHPVDLPSGPAVLDVRNELLTDRRGREVARVVVVRDVTELHARRRQLSDANERLRDQLSTIDQLREHLAEQAIRDELTRLHNRRYLVSRLAEDLAAARRGSSELCVVLLDVDHFKTVNDRHGHATGDDLLAAIARTLRDLMREHDTLARYGGEEFVAVLPGATPEQAMARAQEWRVRCSEVVVPSPAGPVSRTVSMGIASLRMCAVDEEPSQSTLLQAADEALYAAKAGGRNRVVLAPTPATAPRKVVTVGPDRTATFGPDVAGCGCCLLCPNHLPGALPGDKDLGRGREREGVNVRWPWKRPDAVPGDLYSLLTQRSLTALQARRFAQASLLQLDKATWAVDHDEGTITFTRPAGVVASAPVQIIGSLDTVEGTWRWGWDHPSVEPPLDQHARRVRAWGEDHHVPELTTALVDADDDVAWRFAAIACELNDAQGAWRCENGQTAVLVTFGTVTLAGSSRPGVAPGALASGAAVQDDDDWPAVLGSLPVVHEPRVLAFVRAWMAAVHEVELRYRDERIAAKTEALAHSAADRAIQDLQPLYERVWRRDDEYWRPCAVGMAQWYDVDAMSDWAVHRLTDDRWRVSYLDGGQAKAYDVRRFADGLRIVDHLD